MLDYIIRKKILGFLAFLSYIVDRIKRTKSEKHFLEKNYIDLDFKHIFLFEKIILTLKEIRMFQYASRDVSLRVLPLKQNSYLLNLDCFLKKTSMIILKLRFFICSFNLILFVLRLLLKSVFRKY